MDKEIVKEFLKDHFFDIFDQAGNGITITDPNQEDNPIIYVNQAFSDIFKYSYKECVGKNCRFLHAEDTSQRNIELIREAIKEQYNVQTVLRNYTKTGELIYNEIKVSPIFDKKTGKIKFFLGVQKDISDRSKLGEVLKEKYKKRELEKDMDTILKEFEVYETELLAQNDELIEKDKKLEQLNHEFSSLFQNAPVAYVVMDTELEISKFNKLADMYFSFSNVKGKINSLFSVTKNENTQELISWIDKKTYNKKALEINMKCYDEEIRRFSLTAKTYMIDEDLLMVSLNDITESYEIKTKLEQRVKKEVALKLEQEKYIQKQAKLASMGEMIDAIAHQWLNPVTLIRLFTQDSARRLKKDKEKVQKEALLQNHERIITQTNHLENTLDEFRSFYRPDVETQAICVKDLIESTLLLIKDDFLKHQINYTIDIKKDFEINIVKNQFKHVILNLFTNSRDAFEENQIKQKKIHIVSTQDDTYHILEVCDNAGGIPKNALKKIFEPNFTTKATGKGSGIGLYLSKQILDKFNIQIDVVNKNQGACFIMKYKKDTSK